MDTAREVRITFFFVPQKIPFETFNRSDKLMESVGKNKELYERLLKIEQGKV